jgi:hypothetical protein
MKRMELMNPPSIPRVAEATLSCSLADYSVLALVDMFLLRGWTGRLAINAGGT